MALWSYLKIKSINSNKILLIIKTTNNKLNKNNKNNNIK